MRFGICTTTLEEAPAAKGAGWDYVEGSVQGLLQGLVPDEQWQGKRVIERCPLPVPAANLLVPGSLKITGPDADPAKLRDYMKNVTRRAKQTGTEMLVFGSGGARQVPDGFSRDKAREQIIAFARICAETAAEAGVTVVAEPLNRGECNIMNSVAESMEYVRAVEHPNFQCLLDTYHFWLENEPLENLRKALPWIKHVHLADKDRRAAPGESGTANYKPVFRLLKEAGYNSMMSVESTGFTSEAYPRVLDYLKTTWQQA